MANVNKLERMKLEIDRTQNAIDSQKERLQILKQRLEKEKDKEVLRMVREQGMEPEQLERMLKAYHVRLQKAEQGKEAAHASSEQTG